MQTEFNLFNQALHPFDSLVGEDDFDIPSFDFEVPSMAKHVQNAIPVPVPDQLRRVQSASDVPSTFHNGSWNATAPLPIRSTRYSGPISNNDHSVHGAHSSMESAQSLLAASCPDDGYLINTSMSHAPHPLGSTFGSMPHLNYLSSSHVPPQPTSQTFVVDKVVPQVTQWVPEPVTMPQSLPLPMPTVPQDIPLPSNFDVDMSFLDEALDMVTGSAPIPLPNDYNTQYSRHFGGSCPLPTLLEGVPSEEEEDGSDHSHHGHLPTTFSSPSLSMDLDTGFVSTHSYSPVRGSRPPMSKPRSVPSGRSHMERTVRGGNPLGLSSSYPNIEANRPLRTAARRSLAVTAAALRDYDDDSESEGEDGNSYNEVSVRRGGSTSGKKKHNPWTLDETEALVSGVQLAGLGKWAEIKRLPVPHITEVLINRSAVDLKDKWRNLTRVARLPKAQLKARLARSASDVPLEMMLTVKSLMENGSSATD